MATEIQHHFSLNCVEVKDASQGGEFESAMHCEQEHGNFTLCAYTTKSKLKGKKNVLLLSTIRPLSGITHDGRKRKPAIVKFYDFTTGGIDILDQKISKYSCKSVTQPWTMVHFFFLMDTIYCNALTLYAIKHGKTLHKINAFDNGWDLFMSLVKPFIAERPTVGLGIGLQNKISVMLGRNTDEFVEADDNVEYPCYGERKQRCDIWLFNISGVEQKKKEGHIEKVEILFSEMWQSFV